MKGLQDIQFREHYTELLKLDWSGLDLWVVGGIVSDWETQDIDCIVFGERDLERLNTLFNQLDSVWSIFYTEDPRAITMDRYSKSATLIKCYSRNKNGNTLIERVFKFPMTKNLMRMKRGMYHGEPVQLIQNGTQIYL